MKTLLRILLLLIVLIAGILLYIQFTWNKKYDAPYPDIKASTDSAVIARGRYLAFGPAHCGTCHVPLDKIEAVESGLQMPLSGGWHIDIPPGRFTAPNITPDKATGIGNLTDGEIARTLRHSVGSDGRCLIPFMPFQGLSDEDLTAVISFLRSQPAVEHKLAKSQQPTLLGKAVMAFGMIKPEGPMSEPPKSQPIDSTIEYGKYVANFVANCVGCHTDRDMNTGALIGIPFAGGMKMAPDPLLENYAFVTPNLTPDKKTGVIANWDESTFVKRFKTGKIVKHSAMPWGSFSRMNDVELKALYRYLHTLEPTENRIAKTIFPPGDPLPEK